MPIAAIWMDLQIIITVKVVRNRKTNAVWYHLYVESKIWHRRTYLQNRNRLTDIENRLMVVKGLGGRGGMDWELGIGRCRLGQTEWINNKVLLYSTGDYIQYPVKKHNGKEHGKECMYTYNWITLLGSRYAHNIINQLYLNFKKKKKTFWVSPMYQPHSRLWGQHGEQDRVTPVFMELTSSWTKKSRPDGRVLC